MQEHGEIRQDLYMMWLSENYGWLVSLAIQVFIAYHVYFLSIRLTTRAKLEHKEVIKAKIAELLSEVRRKKISSKVYLVNINRYFKDYPSNKEKRFEGYSHIRAELKAVRYDGVEFFSGMPEEVYRENDGSLSFKGVKGVKPVFNVNPVGLVPYEWIEYIDVNGDEFGFVPLIYCRFRGRTNWKFWKQFRFYGYPYKNLTYYKRSEKYDESRDPMELKYEYVDQKIAS